MDKPDKCKDFDKDVEDGFPVKLYHATTDKEAVCRDGLKPRCELDGKCGLGGGTSQLISFTTDINLAKDIAHDLKTVVNIANGSINWGNYCEKLNEVDSKEGMTRTPCEIFNNKLKLKFHLGDKDESFKEVWQKDLEMFKKGFKSEYQSLIKTKDEWLDVVIDIEYDDHFNKKETKVSDLVKDGYKIIFPQDGIIGGDGKERFSKIWYEMTPDMRQDELYEIYHIPYLVGRQESRGRQDPVFFGIKLDLLKELKEDNVGVIEVEGSIPKKVPYTMWSRESYEDIHSLDELIKHIRFERTTMLFDSADEEKEGWNYLSSMKEFRLSKNKFNKLRILKDEF